MNIITPVDTKSAKICTTAITAVTSPLPIASCNDEIACPNAVSSPNAACNCPHASCTRPIAGCKLSNAVDTVLDN